MDFSQLDSTSGGPSLEARPATSSPTVSLSRFPQPPRRAESNPLALTTNLLSRPQQPAPGEPPRQPTPHSAPPTVLHYRGASFDLVNPHESLQLSDIETPEPGERISDLSDYFNPSLAALNALTADMSPRSRHNTEVEGMETRTPSRALYEDYASAHRSILSGKSPEPSGVNLPQMPEAAGRTPGTVGYHNLTSNDELPYSTSQRVASRPTRGPSIRTKLSKAWRRGIDSFRVMDHAVAVQGGELTNWPGQQAIVGIGMPSRSAPGGFDATGNDVENARGLNRMSQSMADMGTTRLTHDDDESIYPSSTYLREDSESMYPSSIIDPRHSVPFGRRTGETDYSSEAGLHSYLYEFAQSDRGSRHLSHPLYDSNRDSSTKESTIGNILDQYRGDVSEPSLIDLQDDDEDAIQISPNDLVGVAPAEAQISTSSLANTEATRVSSQDSSTAPSPRTPDAHVWGPSHPHVFHTSAGVPPPIPLPLMGALPPFAPRYGFPPGSALSDITSGDTYGDTRQLLLLSQQFTEGSGGFGSNLNVVAEQGTQASASSQTLPKVDDEDEEGGRRSPDTVIRSSPPPLSPYLPSSAGKKPEVPPRSLSRVSGRSGAMLSMSRPTTALSSSRVYETPAEYADEYFSAEDALKTPTKAQTIVEEYDSPDVEVARGVANASSPLSQRSSGVPRMWLSGSPRLFSSSARNSKEDSPGKDSYADVEDEDEGGGEGDWETIATRSRQTLGPEGTMSSMANYPDASFMVSRVGLLPPFAPGARMGVHHHRTSSYYSDDPIAEEPEHQVEPLFAFQPMEGPQSQYQQPLPLPQGHQHPFQGAPPVMLDSTPPRVPSFEFAESSQTAAQHAFTGYGNKVEQTRAIEQPTESTKDHPQLATWSTEDFFAGTASRGPHTMSQLLSAGPNDEIMYETDGPDDLGITREITASPEGEPSSPVSLGEPEREDSFSKFTVLGPKTNLTGTPQGTGMREVGSSLADSSSPGAQFSSTPIRPLGLVSSPLAEHSTAPSDTQEDQEDAEEFQIEDVQVESPSARFTSSPPIPRSPEPRSPEIPPEAEAPTPLLAKSKTSREKVETGNLVDLKEKKRRKREERRLSLLRQQTALNTGKRASVAGQMELRELHLVRHNQPSPVSPSEARKNQKPSLDTINTHFSQFAGTATVARTSSDTESPIFGAPSRSRSVADQLRQQVSQFDQRLVNIPPSPVTDSETLHRQQLISWLLFGCATLFPPLLVVYRYGYFDPAVRALTGDKVHEVSRTPKRLSLYLGVTLCVALPVTAIVLVALYTVGVIFQ